MKFLLLRPAYQEEKNKSHNIISMNLPPLGLLYIGASLWRRRSALRPAVPRPSWMSRKRRRTSRRSLTKSRGVWSQSPIGAGSCRGSWLSWLLLSWRRFCWSCGSVQALRGVLRHHLPWHRHRLPRPGNHRWRPPSHRQR